MTANGMTIPQVRVCQLRGTMGCVWVVRDEAGQIIHAGVTAREAWERYSLSVATLLAGDVPRRRAAEHELPPRQVWPHECKWPEPIDATAQGKPEKVIYGQWCSTEEASRLLDVMTKAAQAVIADAKARGLL